LPLGFSVFDQASSLGSVESAVKTPKQQASSDKPQACHNWMVERIMKRKIDNNDLTHYFIRDHRELPASYLKSCEKFFRKIRHKHQATSAPQSGDIVEAQQKGIK